MREETQRESRFFIKLKKNPHSKEYEGELYNGTKPEKKEFLGDLKLGSHAGIRIKGIDTTLGEILEVLENRGGMPSPNPQEEKSEKIFNALSSMEGQRDIGEYLYLQIWPNTALDELIERGPSGGEIQSQHITIVARDNHITKLPWVLMGNEGKKFVLDRDIGVSVSLRNEGRDIQLGPKITFLIAAPNFETEDTDADAHIQEIEKKLLMENSLWDPKNDYHRVITVNTWEEFKGVVKEKKPDIIYYYGHADKGRLAFPDNPIEGRYGAASVDFAAFFRNSIEKEDRPIVVYINCCRGYQGGSINLGTTLEDLFSVVVINRTVAYTETAQKQAVNFFMDILNKGKTPHEAMLLMHRKTEGISHDDIQWWTPVFYRNYRAFNNSIEKEKGRFTLRDWELKIDRIDQYSTIHTCVYQLLRYEQRGAAAFVWYGEKGQGIPEFKRRLEIQLPKDLDLDRNGRQDFWIVQPEWPMVKTEKCFAEAICKAFDVIRLSSIPAKISQEQKKRFNQGEPFLVIISHQPIVLGDEWTFNDLKTYLKLWDDLIIPELDKRHYLLICISYEGEDHASINALLQRWFSQGDDLLMFSHIEPIKLLNPLIQLSVKDIVDVLKKENPEWSKERLIQKANTIFKETGGHYIKTVIALEDSGDYFY